MKKLIGPFILIAGGITLFLSMQDSLRGVLLVVGTLLINIGVDKVTLLFEKQRGEIQ